MNLEDDPATGASGNQQNAPKELETKRNPAVGVNERISIMNLFRKSNKNTRNNVIMNNVNEDFSTISPALSKAIKDALGWDIPEKKIKEALKKEHEREIKNIKALKIAAANEEKKKEANKALTAKIDKAIRYSERVIVEFGRLAEMQHIVLHKDIEDAKSALQECTSVLDEIKSVINQGSKSQNENLVQEGSKIENIIKNIRRTCAIEVFLKEWQATQQLSAKPIAVAQAVATTTTTTVTTTTTTTTTAVATTTKSRNRISGSQLHLGKAFKSTKNAVVKCIKIKLKPLIDKLPKLNKSRGKKRQQDNGDNPNALSILERKIKEQYVILSQLLLERAQLSQHPVPDVNSSSVLLLGSAPSVANQYDICEPVNYSHETSEELKGLFLATLGIAPIKSKHTRDINEMPTEQDNQIATGNHMVFEI